MFLSPKLFQFFSCDPLNYKNLNFLCNFIPEKRFEEDSIAWNSIVEGRHGGFNNLRTTEKIGIV